MCLGIICLFPCSFPLCKFFAPTKRLSFAAHNVYRGGPGGLLDDGFFQRSLPEYFFSPPPFSSSSMGSTGYSLKLTFIRTLARDPKTPRLCALVSPRSAYTPPLRRNRLPNSSGHDPPTTRVPEHPGRVFTLLFFRETSSRLLRRHPCSAV